MKKTFMILVSIAVLTLAWSPLNAESLQEAKIKTCMSNANLVVMIKSWIAAGTTSNEIMSQVNSTNELIMKVMLRNISWAIYYGNNSDEFLRVTYYKHCMDASAGPLNMPGPEW